MVPQTIQANVKTEGNVSNMGTATTSEQTMAVTLEERGRSYLRVGGGGGGNQLLGGKGMKGKSQQPSEDCI